MCRREREMFRGQMCRLVNAQSTTDISHAKRLNHDAKLLANTQPTSPSLNIQPPKHPVQLFRLLTPLLPLLLRIPIQ